jgi:phospholipid transport system substrate-binding protein
MNRMARVSRSALALVSLLLFAAGAVATARAAATAREFVRETADEVLVVLKNGSLDSPAKISRIEDIAGQRFDFETISRLVLAQNWKRLSPEQQREFTAQFKKHLSVTYGRNVDNYADQAVEIGGDRAEARGDWTVQTLIIGGEPPDEIMVDYRLRKSGGEWKVIDVVVERVSLVSNFRSQLRELISSRGVDRTLEMLREKNDAGESILPEEKRGPKPAE